MNTLLKLEIVLNILYFCLLSIIYIIELNIFKHENKVVVKKLMELGVKILDNIDDDKIEKIF